MGHMCIPLPYMECYTGTMRVDSQALSHINQFLMNDTIYFAHKQCLMKEL